MKKMFLTAFIAILALASLSAEGKRFVIDLGDSTTGKVVNISKNQYGTNYQNTNPPVFTKYFNGNMPTPGDVIELHYKLTSNVDLPALTLAIIDNSEAANWWLPISNQFESINDLKAGVPVEGVFQYKVVAAPVSAVSVQMMYDDEIKSKITIQKAGVKTGKR